jgi:hypothetical protein
MYFSYLLWTYYFIYSNVINYSFAADQLIALARMYIYC